MRRAIFLCLLFFNSLFMQAQVQWRVIEASEPVDFAFKRYDDIFMINDSTGWACNADGKIFKISFYGQIVEQQHDSEGIIRAIEFLDPDTGFAGVLNNSEFLRTTDGGDSWQNIRSRISGDRVQVCGLAAADETTLYAVGKWAGPAYVMKTQDKGETWEYQDLSHLSAGLTDAHFFNANEGFITGASAGDDFHGLILKTEDGGQTWEVKHETEYLTDFIWKIQFVNANLGFASVQSFEGKARILKTTDRGENWEPFIIQSGDDSFTIQGVAFINENTGWAGGHIEGLYETQDGGLTWTRLDIGDNINRIIVRSPNLVYASGDRLYQYSDNNFKEPVIVGLHEPLKRINPITLYPNPVSNELTVKFDLGLRTFIDAFVYSMSGQKVKLIDRGDKVPGLYEYKLNVTTLEMGQYFIGLKTSEGTYSEKFLIER